VLMRPGHRCQETLVFGKIIGLATEVSAEPSDNATLIVFDYRAIAGRSRIAP